MLGHSSEIEYHDSWVILGSAFPLIIIVLIIIVVIGGILFFFKRRRS